MSSTATDILAGIGTCVAIVAAVLCVALVIGMTWTVFASWIIAKEKRRRAEAEAVWTGRYMYEQETRRRGAQAGYTRFELVVMLGWGVAFLTSLELMPLWFTGLLAALHAAIAGRGHIRRWLMRRRLWLIVDKAVEDARVSRALRRDPEFATWVRRASR